jgi:parallel beta-helix repeat protein
VKTRTKNRLMALGTFALATFNFHLTTAFAQGSLTPPGAPAPTMKSLAQIEPRTPISALPFTIKNAGSYYLTTNLTGVSGANGVTIASDDVTLDLNGFALTGVPGSGHGVFVSTNAFYFNLTVRDGALRDWDGNGVEAFSGENEVLERLTISGTGGYGIDAFGSTIRDCQVDSCNGYAGIAANNSEISGCVVEYNSYDGIDAFDSQVRNCSVENNGYGIYVGPGTVSGCLIESNVYSGIYVGSSGCQITGNTCLGNNLNVSSSDAGIFLNASDNRVEANHVVGSGYAGIQVVGGAPARNLILRNSVSGDGANNYVTPGQQVVGPLITAFGTITNSNPWANFSY